MADSTYDLSPQIIHYLDKHLVFPIIQYIQEKKTFSNDGIFDLKMKLLKSTKMADIVIEEYQHHGKEVPADVSENKDVILKEDEKLKKLIGPLVDLLVENKYEAAREAREFTVDSLSSKYNVTVNNVTSLYKYGNFLFDTGRYSDAYRALTIYHAVSDNEEDRFSALWGKFAAGLLNTDNTNWNTIVEDAQALRSAIDERTKTPHAEQVQQRTWFMHWFLFAVFNNTNARSIFIDCLQSYNKGYFPDSNEKMLNTIQLNAPHLLRYLSVATVCFTRSSTPYNPKRSNHLRELVRVIGAEKSNYSDPVTEFVHSLLGDFNFDVAAARLLACRPVLQNDFFTHSGTTEKDFFDAARSLFVDTYVRIHTEVDPNTVLSKFGLDGDDFEAPTTSQSSIKNNSFHQQVRDKIRSISNRNSNLQQQLLNRA